MHTELTQYYSIFSKEGIYNRDIASGARLFHALEGLGSGSHHEIIADNLRFQLYSATAKEINALLTYIFRMPYGISVEALMEIANTSLVMREVDPDLGSKAAARIFERLLNNIFKMEKLKVANAAIKNLASNNRTERFLKCFTDNVSERSKIFGHMRPGTDEVLANLIDRVKEVDRELSGKMLSKFITADANLSYKALLKKIDKEHYLVNQFVADSYYRECFSGQKSGKANIQAVVDHHGTSPLVYAGTEMFVIHTNLVISEAELETVVNIVGFVGEKRILRKDLYPEEAWFTKSKKLHSFAKVVANVPSYKEQMPELVREWTNHFDSYLRIIEENDIWASDLIAMREAGKEKEAIEALALRREMVVFSEVTLIVIAKELGLEALHIIDPFLNDEIAHRIFTSMNRWKKNIRESEFLSFYPSAKRHFINNDLGL